jgi:3-oxoacyl-[acyl-carrier protein] reductase
LITGASGTLGRLIALELAQKSIDLILLGQDKPRVLTVAKRVFDLGKGVRIMPMQVDLTAGSAISEILDGAAEFGCVDILVNAAAIQGPIGRLWEIDWNEFRRTIEADFLAPAALARVLIPQMIVRGAGWIVNISGGGSTSARPMFSAYGSAKTALVRFTETLAQEGAPFGIRANAVAPGAFKSRMTHDVQDAGDRAGEKEAETSRRLISSDDQGAAHKAAALIAYLVAGAGRDISGRLISAVWDDWPRLHEQALDGTDWYTLRRSVPGS